MWVLTGVAGAAPAERQGGQSRADEAPQHEQRSNTKDCDGTHHSKTGHGANDADPHAYNETCDGSPSENGVGHGEATGKPCAGCVGNADDKNPPGQAPDGPTDHNAGYECDRNQGIGQTNPAHTGCTAPAGNEGANPPACPAGAAAMTAFDLDDVQPSDTVEVTFTIAAGCTDIEVSLASYDGDRALFHSHTGVFGAGAHTLSVNTPDCATEVDFVLGGVLPHLGTATGSPYRDQGRLIDAGRSSTSCPAASNDPGVIENTNTSPPDVTLVPAVSATTGSTDVVVTPPAAAGGAVGGATTRGRPAEVLGVQIQRGDDLARTGVSPLPLATVGSVLVLVGVGLTSVRSRRSTVSVAARLAGHGLAA